MIRALIAAAAVTLTLPGTALAENHNEIEAMAQIGPTVGEPAPNFVVDQVLSGESITLADMTGDQGAVVVFSRSLDWCPYCKKQSIDLKAAAEPLAELGWELNLVTYDDPGVLAAYSAEQEINYTLLSDTNSTMIEAFNLKNEDVPQGSRYDGIPHPAIVFIDPAGIVKAVLREEGYKNRPPVETVLEQAEALFETTG